MERKWQIGAALAIPASTAAIAYDVAVIPPKGYLVAEIEVTDPKAYKDYAAKAGPIITACGGQYLARGGKVERVEGKPPRSRFVIVEFASFDVARGCYHSSAYQAVAPIRQKASKSRFWLSDGLPG